MFRGLLRGEDHVRVVREHEHLRRGNRLDRLDDLRCGRIHRLPAFDDPSRAEAFEETAIAAPGQTATSPVSSVGSGVPALSSNLSSRWAVW